MTGPGDTHIQEIQSGQYSIFEINNRINAAGGDIGSVLAILVLILISRAIDHIFDMRPRRVMKREYGKQNNEQSRGYTSA